MKAVVVYYSLTGNTALVARMIGKALGADMIRLKPEKEIPDSGARKYILGGKSAIFNEKPRLSNLNLSLDGYDTLILGTPVWAGRFAPPVNTFLSEYMIKDKNVYLFATHSPGTATEQCFATMKEKLSRNIIRGTAEFDGVNKMSAKELDDKVRKFCRTMSD